MPLQHSGNAVDCGVSPKAIAEMSGRSVCVLLFFDGYKGGAELHSIQLVECLRQRCERVALVVKAGQRSALLNFLRLHGVDASEVPIDEFPLAEDMSWAACRRLFRNYAADIYVCPKGGLGSGSGKLESYARLYGRRIVTIEHTAPRQPVYADRRFFPRLGYWQFTYRLRRWRRSIGPARIVAVSCTARNRLVSLFGYPVRRTVAVPNGVATDRFRPVASRRDQIRQEQQIPEQALVCGMVCRFVDAKAIDVAIRAFESVALASIETSPYLLIYGDGPLKSTLIEQSQATAISDKIRWMGATSEPWNVYPAFDLFLLSSRQEGLPLGLLEAMACGCAPVATPVGGVPDVIRHQENGFLAHSIEPADYDATLTRAMRTPRPDLQEISRRAMETICKSYELSIQMNRLCDEIFEACG
ncbi:GDP-mannose-dependent alpha-(1-6)-phosphatidylinositol monomannoside mannosyltransferase [Rosistilla ulvae]|uniref:GDP-mannose-dependent alpha-(1-6)-phosphatidylinositol monomannoside mannosyltransferase n=2 Tax=Rosistilla ulvae TaxID=1930277 RepID=A0A517M0E4_9BACT|nr:GDP-mannose-dependent alpha-(1-6)-phosphatidylinositol monomannoside mannosyltransferase [Rosistilla ulvae]